jgi:hypothetical protein
LKAIVDDQLALLYCLGVLELPPELEIPLLTTYGFQFRIANAIVVERSTQGVLQRLVAEHAAEGVDRRTLVHPDPRLVEIVDPTACAADTTVVRSELGCNTLAAEMIVAARHREADVMLTRGNAVGELWASLQEAGVNTSVWSVTKEEEKLVLRQEAWPPNSDEAQ